MGLPTLLIMSASLAVGAFISGSIPLWMSLSQSHMQKLSAVGTGLLLGAALGVIIPEGVESLVSSDKEAETAPQIALSLLLGFTFMFVLEQFISPHSHEHSQSNPRNDIHRGPPRLSRQSTVSTRVEFDADLDLDQFERDLASPEHKPLTPRSYREEESGTSAMAITAGLVVHGLADGLALGVSTISSSDPSSQATGNQLSFVVFIALLIHKAPTALALTTSLMSHELSRNLTRVHLAIFSAATPVGAIISYLVLNWASTPSNNWAGLALLFSGGTFLYVATVLQPISESDASQEGGEVTLSNRARVIFVILGMFLPFGISSIVGHGH